MFRNLITESLLLRLGDLFFNTSFVKNIKKWRSFDNKTEAELEQYQQNQLKKVLSNAVKNIHQYNGIEIKGNNPQEWLKDFPILTKTELRENPNSLININSKTTGLRKIYSSGSTGVSTYVIMNKKDLSSVQALSVHLWELQGFKIGDKIVQTGISPKRGFLKKAKDLIFGTYYVSAFSLSERDLEKICQKLQKNNINTLIGYPSSINIIADYVLLKEYDIRLKTIIGLGDKLFDSYKANIQKAFHTNIMETYGSSEGFQIGFQVDLDYMYIYSPQIYLEILDDKNLPVKDGEIGNVIVTRLDNEYMPLIRYKIGDLAIKLPKSEYPKSRKYNFPLLKQVIGRDTDVVALPDGRKMVVHSFTGIFEYIVDIKQFKIIQKQKNGIIVEYIPDDTFNNKTLKNLEKTLRDVIKIDSFIIEFKEVNSISNTKSGKTQIIESFL